jgi:hypothetical protein
VLLVEGHVAPTWVHIVRTISNFLTLVGKVHSPSNPTTGLVHHLTHRLEGNSTFDTSHPFFLSTRMSSGVPNSRRSLNLSTWLQPLGLSTYPRQCTPNLRTPEGSILVHGDVLDVEIRTGGSRVLHPPNGPTR